MFKLNTTFKNFLFLSLGRYSSQLILLLTAIYLARILTPSGYGKITFAYTLIAYFMLFTNLGLMTVGTREIAKSIQNLNKYTNNILSLRLVLALISYFILIALSFSVNKLSNVSNLIVIYGLYLFPFVLLLDWAFQGLEKMEYIAITQIINSIIYGVLIFLFVKTTDKILLVPTFWVISGLLSSIFLLYIFEKRFERIRFYIDLSEWKKLLRISLPIGIGYIIGNLLYGFDIIMLNFIKGTKSVGIYSAGYKIMIAISSIPIIIYYTILPRVANLYSENLNKLKNFLSLCLKYITFVILLMIAILMILAKQIIILIYGEQYSNCVASFKILSLALFLQFIYVPYSTGLIAYDKQTQWMYASCFGSITNVISNILLVPRFGMEGAAVSLVLAHLVIFLFVYFTANKVIYVPFLQHLIRGLPSFLTMWAVTYLLSKFNLNIFVNISAGILIYFISAFLTGLIKPQEIFLALREKKL